LNDLGWKVFNALFPRTLESFSRRFAPDTLTEGARALRDALLSRCQEATSHAA
jgi:hypothetical protein